MIYGAGRREERTTSWRELSFCIAALNSSKVTLPSLLASISSNISSSFPGSVMSPRQAVLRQRLGWAAATLASRQLYFSNPSLNIEQKLLPNRGIF